MHHNFFKMAFKYIFIAVLFTRYKSSFTYFFDEYYSYGGDDGVGSQDSSEVVELHNEIRNKIMRGEVPGQPKGVGLNLLKWDSSLAEEAQRWADNCVFQHNDVYDSRFPVGQNLYMSQGSSNSEPDWETAIYDLYDEHRLYTYGEGFSYSTGHYTQLVWADTEYVGCGYSTCGSGYYSQKMYVCNYGPAGNVMGELPYRTEYRKRKNSKKRRKNKKNRKNRLNKKRKSNKKYND